jgi:class 3 adenylate cyclase
LHDEGPEPRIEVVRAPQTHFVWRGDAGIAYQVVGDGLVDLIYVAGYVSNLDYQWKLPMYAEFLQRLASFSRLIMIDRRGWGCSERFPPGEVSTLEDDVDDVLAVMEATAAGPAIYLGSQEGCHIGAMAVAAHPDRFSGLILYGASPSWTATDELPWEYTTDRWELEIGSYARQSGGRAIAESYVRRDAPSLLGDDEAIDWLAAMIRLTCAPGSSVSEMRRLSMLDVRDILPAIRAPTLVLHRTSDPALDVQGARHLADVVPDARLVELPGNDALPWAGESKAVLDEIEEFVTGSRHEPDLTRELATVLFTDIVGSTDQASTIGDAAWRALLSSHHALVRVQLQRFRGREIDTAGDGFLATFDGPARAVSCARAIVESISSLGIEVRAGCHTGEIELARDSIAGIAVHICARIAALAGPSEVLVSQTVKDLVTGSELTFEDLGERELKGISGRWRLHRLAA